MNYDFAVIYFGLTRSLRKTADSHIKHIFDVLDDRKLTYKKFMHTWKMKDDKQNVWDITISQKIDYSEYKLLNPDHYKLDNEDEFLETVNMDDYVYNDPSESEIHGEWKPKLVSNYICMLESQKRGFGMVKDCVANGDTFKFIIFMRPDITIHNDLPLDDIMVNDSAISIPHIEHWEGLNDQVAIMNYDNGCIYENRLNELADYRRNIGKIVAEKYCKYIIMKNSLDVNIIFFNYVITRPML